MAGFGTQPLGVGPFGVGTPAAASEFGGKPQNDESGVSQSTRFIDPKTRQFVFDANGQALGMGAVQQMVQIIASTQLGSSSVRGLGNRAHQIEDAGDSLETEIRACWTDAYAAMVRDQLIEILAIDVTRFGNAGGEIGAKTRMRYRDLTSGIERVVKV